MERTWRWYGLDDPVSLIDIRQVGAIGMVTTLYHIPNGGAWSVEEILKCKAIVEDAGLVWSAVKSIPVHGDIKTHADDCEQWIANYQQTLRDLMQCGTHTARYNFMPVLDRARTDLEYVLPDSSKALRLDQIEFAAFEIHILKHPGMETDYTEEEIVQATECFATMSNEDKACLTRNIIAGLPGVEEGYILDQFRKHLELHKGIDKAKLRENSAVFLKAVIPVAEEVDMHMTVHPDDPPHPILGLPCIVLTIKDMQWMIDTVNSTASGFTTCISSYDARTDSDLVDMIKQSGPHTCLIYLRPIMREDNPKTFHEVTHPSGDVDMYKVAKVIAGEEHHRKTGGKEDLISMRPDHGHQMPDDLEEKTNPGYSAIGRLRDLTGVRGVELAIQRVFFSY